MTDPVAASAATAPDAPALIDVASDRTLRYTEYDDAVESVATHLTGVGIEPGDRVALLSETRPDFAIAFFACWRLGAIAVPLNARLTPTEIDAQLETVDPRLLLATPDTAGLLADVETAAPEVRTIGGAVDDFVELDAGQTGPVEEHERPADADLAYLFTSGTTGDPKAVRLTPGNFRAAARAHRERLGVDPDERWLCPLSTYHMGGLAILVRSAHYGTTAVLQRTADGFDPTSTRTALESYDCTAVSVVPVMARRLLDDGDLPGSLRFVLCGGAPTPPQLVERAAARNVPLCPTYGMTETTSQVATPTPAEAAEHPDSVGTPLAGVDVTLVDDTGHPVETGELGEIVVAGPTVTPGYLGHDGGSYEADGFHTGDVGRLDEAGRLTVLNRREDRILTGGENVHPGEVVDVLTDHPNVDDAVVLGMPDPEWGERVCALVERPPPGDGGGVAGDDTALERFARERLAGYKVPRTIAFTDSLPRTASGTVDRAAARAELRRLTDL